MSFFVRTRSAVAATATALGLVVAGTSGTVAAAGNAAAGGSAASAANAGPAYPSVGRGTHFLDDSALLGSTDEKAWYEANIPFLELPDQSIQSTYYYRWRVWKEHVRPTGTANGDVLTEFFGYPGYAAPFGAINASSDQQIDEGRWVRDQQPVEDDIRYWPGTSAADGTRTWSVTPGPDATPGEQTALYAYATTGPGTGQISAYGRVAATVGYSPAAYSSQIDDQFGSNDLADYSQVQSSVTSGTGEVAPTWSIGGGLASATASQPWFGFLVSGSPPAADQSTAVVQVQALDSGSVNHNSGVFIGLVKDADDYVMAWYNSYYHTVGEDLVINGVLQPPGFQATCCADVTLQPGDHFAVAFSGNTLTSYYQSGSSGPWTELESTSVAPLLDLTDAATRSQYHFAFGLRGDGGAMQLSRFQAGSVSS
jgi:hypothetical protein